jgi:cation/acetate symporter
MGYDDSVYLLGWTGGYVLLALLLAPYLRKFGKFTIPDFVGDRYDSQTARTVAVFCALFVSFTYVAGQMRRVGVVFSRFLEIPGLLSFPIIETKSIPFTDFDAKVYCSRDGFYFFYL